MKYVIYNQTGKIFRVVIYSSTQRYSQAKEGEFVMEGTANDATQKVEFDGFDADGQPVNPRVVDKTPEEIEADNPTPPEVPVGQRLANITNEQWRDVLKRLNKLEKN